MSRNPTQAPMCVIDPANVGSPKLVGEGHGEWLGKGLPGLGLAFRPCCPSPKSLLWPISVPRQIFALVPFLSAWAPSSTISDLNQLRRQLSEADHRPPPPWVRERPLYQPTCA